MINSKIVVCYQANIENQGSYESAESSEYSKEQKELQNLNMRFESFDADGLNLLEGNIQNNLLSDMKDLVAKYDLADEKSSPYAIENPDDNGGSPYIIRSSADLS